MMAQHTPLAESEAAREAAQALIAAKSFASRHPEALGAGQMVDGCTRIFEAACDRLLQRGRLREVYGLLDAVARSEVQLGIARRRGVELAAGGAR